MSGGSISLICKNRASDLLIGGAVSLSLVVELGESILRAADEAAHIFSVQVMRRCDDAEFAVGRRVERENVHVAVDALHDELGEDRNAELVFYHRDDRGVVHIRVADDGRCLPAVDAERGQDVKVEAGAWHEEVLAGEVLDPVAAVVPAAVGGQETDVASDSADSKTKASSGDGTKMDDLTGTIVMTSVQNVLNVRTEPDSEAELAGYLYADCGGTVLEQKDGWTKLGSGELTGWANNDYLLFGEEARKEAKDAGRIVATTKTGALRIRKEPSGDAAIYDLLEEGAKYEVVDEEQIRFSEDQEITADWVAVNYGGKTGYVSSEYVQVDFEIDYGETVEQVKAREEAETARLQAEKEAAAQKQKKEKAAQAEKEANKAAALAADDSVLLAALIQCEAGEEPYEGQVAVGAVVMNRVRSGAYPNTVKGVIYASGQFTPAGSGQVGRVVASGKIKASCLQAAQEAMAGSTPVGIATHFRRAGSREGIVIGHHVFW